MQSDAHSAYRATMQLGKRPDTGAYYVRIDGKRHSLKKFVGHVVTDQAEAKRIFAQIKREVLSGKLIQLGGGSKRTLGEFIAEYLRWAEGVKPATSLEGDKQALGRLVEVAGQSIRLDMVTLKHVDLLIANSRKRGNSIGTVNKFIRHLRPIFGKALEWTYLQKNDISRAKELPKEERPPAYLSGSEISRLLATVEDIDLRRMIAAYLATGRRRNELLNLLWEDVDFEGRRYLVRKAKRHLTKWYPINGAFMAVLVSIGPGVGRVFSRWQSQGAITHMVKKALRAAGFGHLRLHDLRHTFATEFVRSGGNLRVLQELLGHTQFSTTEIYAHVADSHLRIEADRVRFLVDLGGGRKK